MENIKKLIKIIPYIQNIFLDKEFTAVQFYYRSNKLKYGYL